VGSTDQGGKKSISSSPQQHSFMWNTTTRTSLFKKFENSNSHQISQTKISFCLDFHTDHESKLRFHSECFYRDKSEEKVSTQKIKLKKEIVN